MLIVILIFRILYMVFLGIWEMSLIVILFFLCCFIKIYFVFYDFEIVCRVIC